MRISINLSPEMLKRVDAEAKRIGTSRGAMLTTWVGEKISQIDSNRQMFQNINDDIVSLLADVIQKQFTNPDKAFVDAIVSSAAVHGYEVQTSLLERKEK